MAVADPARIIQKIKLELPYLVGHHAPTIALTAQVARTRKPWFSVCVKSKRNIVFCVCVTKIRTFAVDNCLRIVKCLLIYHPCHLSARVRAYPKIPQFCVVRHFRHHSDSATPCLVPDDPAFRCHVCCLPDTFTGLSGKRRFASLSAAFRN